MIKKDGKFNDTQRLMLIEYKDFTKTKCFGCGMSDS